MAMKIDVVSLKLVKPCKPTPPHLRTYKISMIDELNPSMHLLRIFYFPATSEEGLLWLEESLSHVLPQFYPLAGRYNKEQQYVVCDDQGAEYSEAHVDCHLTQLIGARSELLNPLLPVDICAADEPADPMLAVRINRFKCGGVAIAVCTAHRIFDSASLGIFMTAWANAVRGGSPTMIRPNFDLPSYFPSRNVLPHQLGVTRTRDTSIVSKMFRFDKNAIAELREGLLGDEYWRSSTGSDLPPSRNVVVSAVLTQARFRADRARHGRPLAYTLGPVINVRERTVPPLHKHTCGNWYLVPFLEFNERESHALAGDFPAVALKMREAMVRGVRDCARILSDTEFARNALADSYVEAIEKAEGSCDRRLVWITDWSKFGDYELDFGLIGKPVWVSLADCPNKDMFILMNTEENDGIEAWVYLHESDMPFFERDEVIRRLTTSAPHSHKIPHSRI